MNKQSYSGIHVFVFGATDKEYPSVSNGRFNRFTEVMDSAVLVAEGKIFNRVETTINEQYVLKVTTLPDGKVVCFPVWEKNRGFKLQFGGSFVWSNSKDFQLISSYPIPVFDKINEEEMESAPIVK